MFKSEIMIFVCKCIKNGNLSLTVKYSDAEFWTLSLGFDWDTQGQSQSEFTPALSWLWTSGHWCAERWTTPIAWWCLHHVCALFTCRRYTLKLFSNLLPSLKTLDIEILLLQIWYCNVCSANSLIKKNRNF